MDDLVRMLENIPIILCKLERIFPLGFFYSMEHLVIHLPMEVLKGKERKNRVNPLCILNT